MPEGRLGAGQVFAWPSRLVVVGRDAGEALTFSVPGVGPAARWEHGAAALEASLEGLYRVSQIDVGRGLESLRGPVERFRLDEVSEMKAPDLQIRLAKLGLPVGEATPAPEEPDLAAFLKTIYYPDPGNGGGGGSGCASNCSINCPAGACSAFCAQGSCAVCACPTSCRCR